MNEKRVVKRVPIDFSWAVGRTWHGYINPWPGPELCPDCDATGYNAMTKRLSDRFGTWAPKLTKREEKSLLALGFPQAAIDRLKLRKGQLDPLLCDALIEERARRKGIYGLCESCKGETCIPNPNPAVVQLYAGVDLYQEWEPTEPPVGDGWQLWVEEDGPRSPTFETAFELADWCAKAYKEPVETWLTWIETSPKTSSAPKPAFRIPSDHFRIYGPSTPVAIA